MQVRDLIPRIFHHTIFEGKFLLHDIGDSRSKTPGHATSWYAILPVSIVLNLQEDDAKFFEFSKSADVGSPRGGRPSKTCPGVPMSSVFQAASKRSGLISPPGLGMLMGCLGTWDNPELLAVSGSQNSFASFKESPCLAIAESLIQCEIAFFLLPRTFVTPQSSSVQQILRNSTFPLSEAACKPPTVVHLMATSGEGDGGGSRREAALSAISRMRCSVSRSSRPSTVRPKNISELIPAARNIEFES